jgi:RimJ/RimL family protein N-acetyltransferase
MKYNPPFLFHEYHSFPNSNFKALQLATASEPLSLADEYSMQQSWRLDHDKLTFIICTAPTASPSLSNITPTQHDTPETMIGDVNLFIYPDPDFDPSNTDSDHPGSIPLIAELEIMLAPPSSRRKGYATQALRAFMNYISSPERLSRILEEYRLGSDERSERYLKYLRVKVDQGNSASLGLFGKVGFERVGEVNYFGEVELRLGVEGLEEMMGEDEERVLGYGV